VESCDPVYKNDLGVSDIRKALTRKVQGLFLYLPGSFGVRCRSRPSDQALVKKLVENGKCKMKSYLKSSKF